MATPAEIVDAAETTAAEGILSSSVDGRSATAMDPLKMLDVADRLQARDLLAGTNVNGGSRSGWSMLRPARAIPPSASGRSVGDE